MDSNDVVWREKSGTGEKVAESVSGGRQAPKYQKFWGYFDQRKLKKTRDFQGYPNSTILMSNDRF